MHMGERRIPSSTSLNCANREPPGRCPCCVLADMIWGGGDMGEGNDAALRVVGETGESARWRGVLGRKAGSGRGWTVKGGCSVQWVQQCNAG
jgi:hypothetical protein